MPIGCNRFPFGRSLFNIHPSEEHRGTWTFGPDISDSHISSTQSCPSVARQTPRQSHIVPLHQARYLGCACRGQCRATQRDSPDQPQADRIHRFDTATSGYHFSDSSGNMAFPR
jgi:hypothetical protein